MKRFYYGWVVCIAGILVLFITMGTVSNGFSVYLPYIMAEYGLTNAQTSSLVTLRCLVSFFAMLGIGIYYNKVSIRVGVGIAAACAGVSFWLYSVAESYPLFCLGAAISGLSYGLGSMIPISILMHRWFVKHRALALSLCASGSGIATIVLPPITTAMVEGLSIRAAFRIEGIAVFLLTALIILFLRNSPREKGLMPYGQEESGPVEAGETAPTRSYSLTARAWALMACVSLFMGALANPGFSHLSVLYTSEGFDPMVIAVIISATGVMITLGKLIYGEVTDRIGGCRSSLLFGGVLLLGYMLCCLAFLRNTAITGATVLALGIGYPIATIGPSVWANDMSSPDRYPTVIRRLQVIYAGGALVFASVPGILADHFGSYLPAYMLFSAFLAAALLFIALAYRETKRNEMI
ncbi:MAG: MFS transporter [Ruminiclostridium sp.]|nr:MFS transporter [Ruminiclostridium sp.]